MTKTNPINLIKEYMNMKTIFANIVAKACKLAHDTWDYVSYNACSFIGGLFCAYILF